MAKLKKISMHDLNILMDKPVVLFGSGNIAEKTMRKIGESKVSFIIDNSSNLHGTTLNGKAVVSAKAISPEYLIIVCTTDIKNVEKQLDQAGLSPGKDFVLSPLLNDLLAVSELEELNEDFYFTSGTIPNEGEKEGGGLYYCRVRGPEYEVEKIYSGQCYGAIRKGSSLFFVDTNEGVLEYRDGVIKLMTKLPSHTRAHGISFNSELGRYYITCSKIDTVIEMDLEFCEMRRFLVSNKMHQTGEPVHHINDNFSVGNCLYVSMFSSSGNWKQDIFDGCIAEFNIDTGERQRDLASDLYMPHNVQVIDGVVHVLDSLRGHLRFGNLFPQGSFPGFTRGLDYSGGLYFVGQSKNRNYSRMLGIGNNISVDCGVILFNPELKVSRFLQFSSGIGEIHSVVVARTE